MNAIRRLTPLFDRVLVMRTKAPEKTAGGVLIPEKHQEKLREGTVVSVGKGGRDHDGKLLPMGVAVGDKVLLPEYGGTNVKLTNNQDEEYLIFRDAEILAKIDN